VRQRLNAGLRQIAFFVVPSSLAFMALGDIVAGMLLQTGRFRYADSLYVWGILAGSAVGLVASTLGRLYAFTFYALRDTRTPLRFAVLRVGLTAVLGYLCAVPLPRALSIAPMWGAAGLTASAGFAGWIEMLLLRRSLNARIGHTGLPGEFVLKLWSASAAGAGGAWAVKLALPAPWREAHPVVGGGLILAVYGLAFLGSTVMMRVPEASAAFARTIGAISKNR
jgi:putative peptidoglycan lipid II flippase